MPVSPFDQLSAEIGSKRLEKRDGIPENVAAPERLDLALEPDRESSSGTAVIGHEDVGPFVSASRAYGPNSEAGALEISTDEVAHDRSAQRDRHRHVEGRSESRVEVLDIRKRDTAAHADEQRRVSMRVKLRFVGRHRSKPRRSENGLEPLAERTRRLAAQPQFGIGDAEDDRFLEITPEQGTEHGSEHAFPALEPSHLERRQLDGRNSGVQPARTVRAPSDREADDVPSRPKRDRDARGGALG